MPKIAYKNKNFRDATLDIIDYAEDIISDYQAQGLKLTLRQLYYRFVAAGRIPNTQADYSRLGTIINDGRLAGLLDWEAIEDRGRNLNRIPTWENPADIIRSAANSYNIDKWDGQDHRIEVWVEKQALEAVIQDAAEMYDVPSFACKGYMSQSEMWRASMRFIKYEKDRQVPIIIHLGDHDPSGIDMTRDIADRLNMFTIPMEVNRIALNMNQIQQYAPPPNPAKMSDSRAYGYVAQFGSDSWELDALEPKVLRQLIHDTILQYLDLSLYNQKCDELEEQREKLNEMAANWED